MTAASIDLEKLLAPISAENPAGRYLIYDPVYSEIKAARKPPELEVMDQEAWRKVRNLTSKVLASESKDLQVAVWLLEALVNLEGFEGLQTGLQILRGLIKRYWSGLFPEIDKEDPDEPLYARTLVMEWLNVKPVFRGYQTGLPDAVKALPLTGPEPGYGLLHYEVTQTTGDEKKALIQDGGWPDRATFDSALVALPPGHWELLGESLQACQDELKSLEEECAKTFVADGSPILSFQHLRDVLEDCQRLSRITLDKVKQASPAPAETPAARAEEPPSPIREPVETAKPQSETAAPEKPSIRQPPPPPAALPGSADEALRRIFELARHLRQDNPLRPISYMLSRAVAWGHLIGFEQITPRTPLPAPAPDLRQRLKELHASENWLKLLEACEQALDDPANRVWLDLHRYTLQAMEKLGDEYQRSALGVRSMLRGLLEIHPELPNAEMEDGTMVAGAETREWLAAQAFAVAPAPVAGSDAGSSPSETQPPAVRIEIPPQDVASAQGEIAETLAEASRLLRGRQVGEALVFMQKKIAEADSGRIRFLGKLHLAEICLQAKRQNLAYPILNELAEIIDEFRLEEWEGKEIVGRAWADLVRCCRQLGRSYPERKDRAEQIFNRLCRLDIARALEVEKG